MRHRAEIFTIGDELAAARSSTPTRRWLAERALGHSASRRPLDDQLSPTTQPTSRGAVTAAAARADWSSARAGSGPTEDDLHRRRGRPAAGGRAACDEPAHCEQDGACATPSAASGVDAEPPAPGAGAGRRRVLRQPGGRGARASRSRSAGAPVICAARRAARAERDLRRPRSRPRAARAARRRADADRARASGACSGRASRTSPTRSPGSSTASPARRSTIQVKFPETLVKLVVRDRDERGGAARGSTLDGEVRARLGDYVYGDGDETLVERGRRRLLARAATRRRPPSRAPAAWSARC